MVKNKLSSNELGKIWDQNADLWVKLSSCGYDRYRDFVSNPGFFKILPQVNRLKGLDIGCGDGHNTNKLATLGAIMTGMDISEKFIKYANENVEKKANYIVGDASSLSLDSNNYDFVVAFNSLMGIPNLKKALKEVHRVLKSEGFFQFSITHPCFWRQNMSWVYNKKGGKTGLICNDYFSPQKNVIGKWMFDGIDTNIMKKRFETPLFKRSLAEWINTLVKAGFQIEETYEPQIDSNILGEHPELDGASIVPFSLIVRCRKLVS